MKPAPEWFLSEVEWTRQLLAWWWLVILAEPYFTFMFHCWDLVIAPLPSHQNFPIDLRSSCLAPSRVVDVPLCHWLPWVFDEAMLPLVWMIPPMAFSVFQGCIAGPFVGSVRVDSQERTLNYSNIPNGVYCGCCCWRRWYSLTGICRFALIHLGNNTTHCVDGSDSGSNLQWHRHFQWTRHWRHWNLKEHSLVGLNGCGSSAATHGHILHVEFSSIGATAR